VGTYYDFKSDRVYGGVEASVIRIKDLVYIDVGGLSNGSRQAPLVAAGVSLLGVCNKFGWAYKLPNNMEVVAFYARNFFYEDTATDPATPGVQKWFAGVGIVMAIPIGTAPATTP